MSDEPKQPTSENENSADNNTAPENSDVEKEGSTESLSAPKSEDTATATASGFEAPESWDIVDSPFGKIKPVSIVSEMSKSYLDYAMSVIVARALPDIRDGLKPVHRRILYSMYVSGIHHSKPYKKSARIVGDVLGRYHPHGDSAVYMALVRLAQDFSMRYPLIDGQGNFGSVDGDSPAAMRYTEARLAKITLELLFDINKKTVSFSPNFDGSLEEPDVLPARLPNLLLMGAEGIAVGMATKIPPHNLTEVCKAIISVIKKGKSTLPEGVTWADADIDTLINAQAKDLIGTFYSETSMDEILEHVTGPDFPTGGIIYDQAAIHEAYRTGKGRIVTRAKTKIEEGKKGYQIIITELPYQVNKAKLIMRIADLVRDKKIVGIRDINDDSDRTGMQITIDLKRDGVPKIILNKLFKYTDLQTVFPVNMVALTSEGTPALLNIKQILSEYVAHRLVVVARRSQFELKEAKDRAHILEGLIIALNNLDDVIETIRKAADADEAKQKLMAKFGLSEVQALAILDMQLRRLAALERKKIEEEYAVIKQTIDRLVTLLKDPIAILGVIENEVNEIAANFGDDRKTKVIKGKVGEFADEDLVANESTVITLTQSGYVKRLDPASFRSQARGGKGTIGMTTKDEDVVKHLVIANTHDSLLLFTNKGRVFKIKVYEMSVSSRQAKGTAIVNLISLQPDEKVQSVLVFSEKEDQNKFIALATTQGLVKKTAAALYQNIRQTGIIAITLNDGDELVGGRLTSGNDHLLLVSHAGKSIRFGEDEVKASNRDTKGVRGITLAKNDYVVAMEAVNTASNEADDDTKKEFVHLLLISAKGMGKRTAIKEYPMQKRSGQGVKVSEITTKTGPVAAAMLVNQDHDELVITTTSGQTIKLPIDKKTIPILTRPTQGVILMRLKGTDGVAAAAVTWKEEAIEAAPTAS